MNLPISTSRAAYSKYVYDANGRWVRCKTRNAQQCFTDEKAEFNRHIRRTQYKDIKFALDNL